jgi:hypothetical protein
MDAFQIIQTVTLVATLIVVGWYTIETHRLRKSSEGQAAAFRDQIRIAQEHLKLAQRQAIDAARPRVIISPHQGGSPDRYSLINGGGIAYEASVTYEDGTVIPLADRTLERQHAYPLKIKLHTSPLRVTVRYHDGIGTRYLCCFEVCGVIIGLVSEKNSFENPGLQ